MGRPLRKEYFHNPANPGKQLQVTDVWLEGEAAASPANTFWIKKQINPRRFVVTNGTKEGIVNLQAAPLSAGGQARIAVAVFGGGTEYARKITNRKVHTFEDGIYTWNKDFAASEAGQADLPLA